MKAASFDYARPADVGTALDLIADESQTVKIAAGTQSLGPMLNMRLVQPDLLVDITGIAELRQVEADAEGLTLGACITHADIEDRRVPDVTLGAMPTVAGGIAYRAVRNRGTIGGSLTHADPSADWVTLMMTLGARVRLRGPAGERVIAAEAYMLGALEADLRPGEMLVAVLVPKLGRAARWGYFKACRKTGEFAHAMAAFLTDPDRGISRAVIGATESHPFVLTSAEAVIGDGRAARAIDGFDAAAARDWVERAGMSDPIARQTHVVALRRALEQAHSA